MGSFSGVYHRTKPAYRRAKAAAYAATAWGYSTLANSRRSQKGQP
jgi:hypothetical protein